MNKTQRELKFRVWNGQRFIPMQVASYQFFVCAEPEKQLTVQGRFLGEKDIEHPEWIIQQYTGLKDKNGKEVYEGDVIKYDFPTDEEVNRCKSPETQNIVEVKFSHEGQDYHPGWVVRDLWGQYGDIVVIGNIFENPELLEKK